MTEIVIKVDNRYRRGNIQRRGNTLRGNADTMALKHLVIPLASLHAHNDELLKLSLNPPIVIGYELSEYLGGTI